MSHDKQTMGQTDTHQQANAPPPNRNRDTNGGQAPAHTHTTTAGTPGQWPHGAGEPGTVHESQLHKSPSSVVTAGHGSGHGACAVHVCNNQFSEASELKIDT